MKKALIFYCLVMMAGCYGKKPETIKTGLEGQPMPAIDLVSIDSSSHFSTTSIAPGKPTILFAFEPWCPYCKAQTTSMLAQIKKLQDINIYMLCTSPYEQFRTFYNKYHLEKYPNIKAGVDHSSTFANYFHPTGVPYLAIYSKQKKLKEVMTGKNYIKDIKEAAFN